MRIELKTATGILALLLGGALGYTPALAQQAPANNPPPPPAQTRSMHVWVVRGPGAGWAAWSTREDNRWRGALGMGGPGAGGFALQRPLEQAQRALHDPLIRQQLRISDDQAKTLEKQVADFQKKVIQDQANLEIQRVDLQNLLTAENPDRSAINNKLDQVNSARLALQKSALNFYLTVKQEITPEQQQKIRQFLGEQRNRRNEGFRRPRRPRPENRRPVKPGSSSYEGAQPPNGAAYGQNEQQQSQYWQNSQGQPEESPAPQPYGTGEPQGSTPTTNNQ